MPAKKILNKIKEIIIKRIDKGDNSKDIRFSIKNHLENKLNLTTLQAEKLLNLIIDSLYIDYTGESLYSVEDREKMIKIVFGGGGKNKKII